METPVYRGIFHRVYTRWVDKLKVGYKLQLGGQAKSRVQTSVKKVSLFAVYYAHNNNSDSGVLERPFSNKP